jgi:hypothetical protein
MNRTPVTVLGVVKPDGTLELEGKVPLPAGKVQVTLQPLPELPEGDPFFDLLRGIWAARAQAGLTPRSEEEVKAQRQRLNDEMEEEVAAAGRLQDECRAARNAAATPRQEAK